eukprot:scaffold182248_cov40-Attheya_sp.AAC.2
MAELLMSGCDGITAETATREDNESSEMAGKIKRFREGETQILCATKGKEHVYSNYVAEYFLTSMFVDIP